MSDYLIREYPTYSDGRCEDCHFLGNYQTNSLYYCSDYDNVIVQYGPGWSDVHAPDNWRKLEEGDDPHYFEARRRAIEMGLIKADMIEGRL